LEGSTPAAGCPAARCQLIGVRSCVPTNLHAVQSFA
jgi:hypothetical protein